MEEENDELRIVPRGTTEKTSRKGQNMIAVASGKGGVGKTWFSITLAHALSSLKKKTLLFDGDLGLANVDIQLGLMVKDDLGSVIAETKTLNQVIMHSDKAHCDIIAGRSGSAGLASMPIGRLQILGEDLTLLAHSYQKVILDMGAGVEKSVRILSSLADKIIVVCTDEPTSLTDAYAFIKIMSMQYPKCHLNIVVNQANSIREGERTYETLLKACHNFLKISPPLLGVVRRDTRVRDSIRSQMPLLSRYPTSEAAEDVIAIARQLILE
ncbi:MAG: MinD/ParA family protein [Alphaproteobacteria bacterium]|nr:MinD/ParA family protein [Alphaproteobacteria bacterium]